MRLNVRKVQVKTGAGAPTARHEKAWANGPGMKRLQTPSAESAEQLAVPRPAKFQFVYPAPSALGGLMAPIPGPLAQAFTFRAFGALRFAAMQNSFLDSTLTLNVCAKGPLTDKNLEGDLHASIAVIGLDPSCL